MVFEDPLTRRLAADAGAGTPATGLEAARHRRRSRRDRERPSANGWPPPGAVGARLSPLTPTAWCGPQADPRASAPDPRLPLARRRGVWLPGGRLDLWPGRRCPRGRSSASRTARARCRGCSSESGWTPQVPITRAIQRDEEAIERWRVESWPALKEKARRERRELVFVDESGFYLLPGVVKTYAPRGRTPIVDEWQTRDHLSVMGGVTLAGQGLYAGAAAVAERAAYASSSSSIWAAWPGIGCW